MKVDLQLSGKRILVRTGYHPVVVELLKRLDPRRKWIPEEKAWSFPCEGLVLSAICDAFGLDLKEQVHAIGNQLLRDSGPAALNELMGFAEGLIGPTTPPPVDLSLIDGYQFLTEPYEHQRRGLAELLLHPRWLLGYEQGTGKSKIVCDRLRFGFARYEFASVLILCPKSVLTVWPEQLRTHGGFGTEIVLIGGSPAQKRSALATCELRLRAGHNVVAITNYDSLPFLLKHGYNLHWQVVVADEVQFCKNLTSKRSKLARRISSGAMRRYGLSGTPAPNSPADWFGVLTFLDPKILGSESKTALTARYCLTGDAPNGGRMVVGYKNLSDLNRRVASVCSRVKKEDCLDLPPKVFGERRCTLAGEQARVYAALKRDAVARLVKAREDSTLTLKNVLAESLRLLQVCGGHCPDDTGVVTHFEPNAKMQLLAEVLDECPNEPVVLWCSFLEEIHAVAEWLSGQGKSLAAFYGDLNDQERAEALDHFKSGDAQYLVATPQSGGMGITLVNAAVEIFYSRTYRADHYWQAIDRLHRPGQTRSVTVIDLVAEGTVDRRVMEALAQKERVQEFLMSQPVEDML